MAIILIVRRTPDVPDSPGKYRARELYKVYPEGYEFSGALSLEAGLFIRFTVTDKTVKEVEEYTAPWNKVLEFSVTQGPDENGFRRIKITNTLVSNSGENGWQQENIDEFISAWNELYPESDLVLVGFDNNDCVVEGTFTEGQKDEFVDVVTRYGLNEIYHRRLYYITQEGYDLILDAGGSKEGTAQQFGQILRSGLDT